MQTLHGALTRAICIDLVEYLSISTHSLRYFFARPSSLRISRRYMTNV
jgi:hypothetical protein